MTHQDPTKILQRAFNVKNQKDCLELYKDWANTYDQVMVGELNYIAPILLAACFSEVTSDKDSKILDLGCGTGLVGVALKELNYRNIDGLDFSQEMLDAAKKKSCYTKLLREDLTKTTSVAANTYDAMICAGLFTYGHLDATCIDECLRMLKPHGIFGSAIRDQVWDDLGFAKKFAELEANGDVEVISKQNLENYQGGEKHGIYLFIRKLK